jgi:predicted PurR-regulated permease PerM
MDQNYKNLSYTSNLLFIIGLVFILYVLKPIVVPLLFAIILSISIFPVVLFFQTKLKLNRAISAVLGILLLVVVVLILFAFIGAQLSDIIDKSDQYSQRLNQIVRSSTRSLESRFGIKKQELGIGNSSLTQTIKDNFSSIVSFASSSGTLLADAILIPLYMFFFIFYRKFFRIFLYKVFCKHNSTIKIKLVFTKLYTVQQNYLIGLFTVMGIVGVLNTVALILLGIENPVFYGFLAAFLLLVPYIGILIGSLIPALIALVTKDSYWYSVGVIGAFGFIQFLEGNFITPKVTGSKVSINSFVAILSIIAFSMLWGIAGMIVALPIVASLKVLFDASPSMRPYGFLLGEPQDIHLYNPARLRLKIWKKIRTQKKTALKENS